MNNFLFPHSREYDTVSGLSILSINVLKESKPKDT